MLVFEFLCLCLCVCELAATPTVVQIVNYYYTHQRRDTNDNTIATQHSSTADKCMRLVVSKTLCHTPTATDLGLTNTGLD